MKTIPLTQGKVALVDDADYELVQQYKWRASQSTHVYYARSEAAGKRLSMHRLILSAPPDAQVDHINGDGLDNRRSNLRLCTNSQNGANRRKYSGHSRFKGVQRHRSGWQARIRNRLGNMYLGKFNNEIDAAKAYDRKARELYGDFANLNFPAAALSGDQVTS